MCRSIKPLFNYEPAVTSEEVEAAALQYVRKVSGYRQPSATNAEAFRAAVREVTIVTQQLLDSLSTTAAPRDRQAEIEKARAIRNAAQESRFS